MKQFKNSWIAAFTTIAFLTLALESCKKENLNVVQDENNKEHLSKAATAIAYQEGDIILGQKLKNPYTVTNMQTAYNIIKQQGVNIPSSTPIVRSTHYYVKFKPQNEQQYEIIAANPNLKLLDYPIDVQVIQNGNRYHDPSLPATTPTYQYTAVKTNFSFSTQVPYEILGSLYIPEEDPTLISNVNNEPFIDALLTQAYIQTENYGDTVRAVGGKYRPAGKIQVFDTRLQQLIGLEGVQVRARRWFTTYTGNPDFYGNYSVNGTFKRPCNYSFWLTANKFSVREHLFGLTFHVDGPKISSNWDYDISDGYDRFEAHIFRGAFRYHYKDIDGLQRPFRPGVNRTIYVGKDQSKDWSGVNYIVFPILKIARYHYDIQYASDEVFSTTIHETAHTSHVIKMNTGIIQYSQVTSQLQESWAIGVEWWLTKLEYKNTRGISNYGDWNYSASVQYPNEYAYQYWNTGISPDYTSLYINLIDNYNELGQSFPGRPNGIVNDQVNAYKLATIESKILKHAYGLSSLSTYLKNNKPTGVTNTQIDLLLSYY